MRPAHFDVSVSQIAHLDWLGLSRQKLEEGLGTGWREIVNLWARIVGVEIQTGTLTVEPLNLRDCSSPRWVK